MSFSHGKNLVTLLGGYDISPFCDDAQISKALDEVETTTFGSTAKQYLTGFQDGSISLGGFFDGSAAGSDAILDAAFNGGAEAFTVGYAGTAVGNRADLASALDKKYDVSGAVGAAVKFKAELRADGGAVGGVFLHALGAETATGTGTAVDGGAATSAGYLATLHVTGVSGTATPTVTVKIQDSADNSTWADLITFTAATAIGGETKSAATGTVRRYTRAIWTISGTTPSLTFAVALARR